MIFPVSGVETAPWVPPVVAFVISFFTSMGGISGAFLLLPFQVSVLGFASPAVSSTNMVYNVIATPAGVYRYFREGRMAWPLVLSVIVGTFPGVLIGVLIRIIYLPDPGNFKFFVGAVLLYVGVRLAYDTFKPKKNIIENGSKADTGSGPAQIANAGFEYREISIRRIAFNFAGQDYSFSPLGIGALSLLVGIIGGAYGIGGGAIIAPIFVAVFGLPIYAVAGATLAGTFLTSAFGIIFYQVIAPVFAETSLSVAPDWRLGFFFGIGGLAGIYLGARCQKFVPAGLIKFLLSLIILMVAGKYLIQFF